MTYRHIKFVESPVMRSLEKKAIEKGWIQPKQVEIKKEASSNFEISDNFDMNIANLISGLKKEGMNKLAKEIQDKFVAYKQSETKLYNLKINDPNDLVEQAHPDGSVDLDLGGDSVVEDIYEIHNKLMNIVNKKKINKSAQNTVYNEIISQLKSLLAQEDSLIKSYAISKRFLSNCIFQIEDLKTPNDFSSIINIIRNCQNNIYIDSKDKNTLMVTENFIKKLNKIEGFVYVKQHSDQFDSNIKSEDIINKNIKTKKEQEESNKNISEHDLKDKYMLLRDQLFQQINNFGKWVNDPKWKTKGDGATEEEVAGLNQLKLYYNGLKNDFKKLWGSLNTYFNDDMYEAAKLEPTKENQYLLKPFVFNSTNIKINGIKSFENYLTQLRGRFAEYKDLSGAE